MSEYEIFNNTEEPVVQKKQKPVKIKEKKVKEKKVKQQSCDCSFLKDAFNLNNISLPLSVFSVLFSLVAGFISIVGTTYGAYITFAIFAFFGIALAVSSLVIETIKMVKNKSAQFNIQIVFVVVSLVISALVLI